MNKKLLIGLSSMALVAGFWACGEGSVEVIEEQSDDEMIQALLSTGNMNFGATDIKKAKDACMNDFECFNEMTKAQGAAIVESSSEEAISSATPVSSTVASSSSDGFKFSSIGPIGDLSSSSEVAPPPQSSSSEDKQLTGLGDCGPSTETVELNEETTWKFTMGSGFGGISAITSAQFEWTFEGGTPATSTVARSVTSGKVSYGKSGVKTASVKVSLGTSGSEVINCSKSLQVNGIPIKGCKCTATNPSPDIAANESASWAVTGCTSTGATITSYTWTGATADATGDGTEATAAVTTKGQTVSGVSVAVANDDNTVVTVTCPAATAINSDIPDFSISKTDDRVTFDKSGEYSLVADLPQGWHNSDATCTVFCNGGNTSYSVSIDGITIAGTNYVSVQSKMQVAHTIGKYAMPVKVTLGSDNAPIECGIGW